jgi:site-specific DNA-cytosine methylase
VPHSYSSSNSYSKIIKQRKRAIEMLRDGEIIVDNFAGGGGASLGIEMALGRGPDIAINHDPEAIAMHAANHPHTRHYCESVWDVSPKKVTEGRPVGLAWFSPDCFPAGTLVLTQNGYRPIEGIEIGDKVLTHKLRWRAVTQVHHSRRPLIEITGHGHPGLQVSPEHPFYARQRKDIWNNKRRSYDRTLEQADWAPASILNRGWYWAAPTQFPETCVPLVPGRGMELNVHLMWLAGRYLGDGWTRLTDQRAELVITCGRHEVEQLRGLLGVWPRSGERAGFNELEWHERETGTAYQFTTNHRGLVGWLREHFSHRAEAKGLPAWALGMEESLKLALLEGYMSADGWKQGRFCEAVTVSKALAFGLKALLNSLGKTVAVYKQDNTNVIQGRQINSRPCFKLRWRNEVEQAHVQTFSEEGLEWCPVRSQTSAAVEADVFNIAVEEDESYVVEGIVVHNCKHFSKAKGGKPVDKKIRGLAWVVIRWARDVRPRIIMVENVEEFKTWGKLGPDNKPCPISKGLTFQRWVRELKALGYRVEFKELRGCDHDTATIRKRLFVVARRDDLPIAWPEPTHGPSRANPYRTAAECIDWSQPCPSIFNRKKPLAENTLRRIARGIQRYVIESANPFIVSCTQTGGQGAGGVRAITAPLSTIVTKAEQCLISPVLAELGHGEHKNKGARRPADLHQPIGTVMAGGGKFALVSAFLAKHYTGVTGSELKQPIGTVTTVDHHSLVTSHMVHLRGGQDSHGNCSADLRQPTRTITANGLHQSEVRALLIKYYGSNQAPVLTDPLHTITTKDRFGLVTVQGQDYQVADIGMRMLTPRELFRAQGFPDSYLIDVPIKYKQTNKQKREGKPKLKMLSKSAQVRMVGNSVCPPVAAALVQANVYAAKPLGPSASEWEPGLVKPGTQLSLFDLDEFRVAI